MPTELRTRDFPDQGGGTVTEAAARAALTAISADALIITTLTPHGSIPAGNVISMTIQDPARIAEEGGTPGSKGTAIFLLVSTAGTVIAPNIVPLAEAAAEAATIAALLGFAVVREHDFFIAHGTVMRQVPAAGAHMSQGAVLTAVVSRGPVPAIVPSLRGHTQADAVTRLTGTSYSLGTVSTELANRDIDRIVSQSPAAGIGPASGAIIVIAQRNQLARRRPSRRRVI